MDIDHESVYMNDLFYLGNGHPVWEPDPDTLYDRVRIGDVGYFQDGKFLPLFNVLPPDDSNGDRHLPFPQPDFPPLLLRGNPTTHRRNPLGAGVHALESSLTFSIVGGVDGPGSVVHGETSLSFTNEKGAALILPYEAEREDVINKWPFKKHMLDNYRTWSDFTERECQLERGTRLILVTGCDLTRQWATATYCRTNRDIALGGGGGVGSAASARFSLSAGWSRNQAMNTRQGPPQSRHRQALPDREETWNHTEPFVNNQCVFLRGFYIKFRFLLGPKVLKAGAGYHDPGKHGPEEEEAEGLLADVTVESLSPPTQDESLIAVLLDYMLEKSDADVVIAHDSDLLPYLQGGASRENFREILVKMSPHIKVDGGMGSLAVEDIGASDVAEKEVEHTVGAPAEVMAEHARSSVIEMKFRGDSLQRISSTHAVGVDEDELTLFDKNLKIAGGVFRGSNPGFTDNASTSPYIKVEDGDAEAGKSANELGRGEGIDAEAMRDVEKIKNQSLIESIAPHRVQLSPSTIPLMFLRHRHSLPSDDDSSDHFVDEDQQAKELQRLRDLEKAWLAEEEESKRPRELEKDRLDQARIAAEQALERLRLKEEAFLKAEEKEKERKRVQMEMDRVAAEEKENQHRRQDKERARVEAEQQLKRQEEEEIRIAEKEKDMDRLAEEKRRRKVEANKMKARVQEEDNDRTLMDEPELEDSDSEEESDGEASLKAAPLTKQAWGYGSPYLPPYPALTPMGMYDGPPPYGLPSPSHGNINNFNNSTIGQLSISNKNSRNHTEIRPMTPKPLSRKKGHLDPRLD